MSRYIKDIIFRQDAIELAMQYCPDDDGTCSKADEDIRNLLDELEGLPSAVIEAETVRHGHWVLGKELSREYIGDVCISIHYDKCWCSECDYPVKEYPFWTYCPNCGAKMDEVCDERI